MFFPKRLSNEAIFLLGICLLFFYLRFPSFYEPYWYGDEGIYFTIGQALREGRELYTGIWDNKPPLLYWFYTLWNDLFSIRFVSLLFGMAAVISFFFLSRKLFPGKYAAYLTTILFSLFFALPTIEGNIANAENFMLFPIIAGAFCFWLAGEREYPAVRKAKTRLLSGMLLGIAFLFKTVALFDFAAFLVFAFFLMRQSKPSLHLSLRHFLSTYTPYLAGFSLPLILVSLFFLMQGILPEFLTTIFLRNAAYVGEKNVLLIPQGFLVIKLLLLGTVLVFLYRIKAKLNPPTLFVLTWTAFSLFNAFFSQRPYVHYQLILLPSLTLLVGVITTQTKPIRTAIMTGILLGILFLLYTTFPHWKTHQIIPYYGNFLGYLTGQKTLSDYRSFFDRNTIRDYALSDYLKLQTNPGDEVFLWGDSAQIYYLSGTLPTGRYAVSYHIVGNDAVSETMSMLEDHPPKLLLILPGTQPLPFTMPEYLYKMTIADTAIYERRY